MSIERENEGMMDIADDVLQELPNGLTIGISDAKAYLMQTNDPTGNTKIDVELQVLRITLPIGIDDASKGKELVKQLLPLLCKYGKDFTNPFDHKLQGVIN